MSVQEGHQYPAVTRVLKPDGGTDITSEWWYYDNGGTYPWNPDVQLNFLSWTAPTERADGSTLVPIQNYTIEWGAIGGDLASAQVPGSQLYFDFPITPVEGVTYRARISATDTAGKRSQLSGFVYLTVAASPAAQAVIDRMANLSPTETAAIIAFVDGNVADGNWALLDEFWCYALNDTNTDWLTGWKAHTTPLIDSITRTNDGAFTPGTSRLETDLVYSSLTNFQPGDSMTGVFVHSWPVLGNTRALFGAQTAAGPTNVNWRVFAGTSQVSSEMNAPVIVNTFAETGFAGTMLTSLADATTITQYVDDTPLAVTGGAATLSSPTIALKFFARNVDGADSERCDSGTVITSSWVGAGIGFNLTTFGARLATLHAALGVS